MALQWEGQLLQPQEIYLPAHEKTAITIHSLGRFADNNYSIPKRVHFENFFRHITSLFYRITTRCCLSAPLENNAGL